MSNKYDLSIEKNWISLKKNLKNAVGESAFNNWLKQLNFISLEDISSKKLL